MSAEAYQLDPRPSAQGAQGAVYFGTRLADHAPIAVKIASGGRGAVKALNQEIEVLRALARAGVGGVVPCIDIIEHGGAPGMVMPRYPRHLGDWLNQAVVQPDDRTLAQALRYCSSVAYTLGRVHQTPWQGGTLVHRDIKPENVFLDGSGAPHVGDFGGAMAIGGLERVEIGLFGTPMWAPLDQILPGQAIPDPTWDTYALCVFLYSSITGARPAYQSDPRTLLTPAGRDLWDVARKAVEGPEAERGQWARHFARMRTGAKASDLVDVTGHGALVGADKAAIDRGVHRLGALAGLQDRQVRSVTRSLWDLLVRGLSPVSHPSPPNRFRDAIELGELLDEIRDQVRGGVRTPAPVAHRAPIQEPPSHPALMIPPTARDERPKTTLSSGVSLVLLAALGLVAMGVVGAAGFMWREPLLQAVDGVLAKPDRVTVPGGDTMPDLAFDRLEVTAARWRACVDAGECPAEPAVDQPGEEPVIGLSLEDARAVCGWSGGRLPTEAEWLHAVGHARMPWGDAPATCDHAVAMGCGGEIRPAGSARAGRSPAGVEDLAGNAWEWATTDDGGVLLGGGALSPLSEIGRGGRQESAHGAAADLSGARCVYPAPAH